MPSSCFCKKKKKGARYQFTLAAKSFNEEDIPIALITVNGNIFFATVRTQEHKSGGSFAGHVTSPWKIKVF